MYHHLSILSIYQDLPLSIYVTHKSSLKISTYNLFTGDYHLLRVQCKLMALSQFEYIMHLPSCKCIMHFFILPYLSSIQDKANRVAIVWIERRYSLGSCHLGYV